MSDSAKLADVLARKKAARLAAQNAASAPQALAEPPSVGRRGSSFNEDGSEESEDVDRMGATLKRTSVSDISQYERSRSGIADVQLSELDLESDKIAQGGLGVLYKGMWRGCAVAVKKPVDPRAALDASLKQDFQREVDALSAVRHPNIVLLMGACLRAPNLCMVFEWCGGGTLRGLLYSRSDVSKEKKIRLLCGVASALTFLHTCSPAIIHRDVKPENVLMDETQSIAKLCDFGLSIDVSEAAETRADAGTPMYMAPELYRGECCSLASDVYAFGLTLWETFSRETPFGGRDIADIREDVLGGRRPAVPLTCPRQAGNIIKDCWTHASEQRPTMKNVLEQLRGMLQTE